MGQLGMPQLPIHAEQDEASLWASWACHSSLYTLCKLKPVARAPPTGSAKWHVAHTCTVTHPRMSTHKWAIAKVTRTYESLYSENYASSRWKYLSDKQHCCLALNTNSALQMPHSVHHHRIAFMFLTSCSSLIFFLISPKICDHKFTKVME
jgi:hypothetical protein